MQIITGDEKRKLLLEGLELAGWPEGTAQEAVDLAFNACEKSLEAMTRVTMAGSTNLVQLQAMMIAAELITGKLEMAHENIDENDGSLASLEELREKAVAQEASDV